ncbi:MAG TPA: J domain-containing protein [Clostridiales bacterium]|nr:J domain-containing protein [Clostridiales bacterium]
MPESHARLDAIKRKVRGWKKLENKIRFNGTGSAVHSGLVWDEFFDLHDSCQKSVRYTLNRLAVLNDEELGAIASEFFWNVYYRFYKENGIVNVHLHDPEILRQMGLPGDSDQAAIKKRFRELAKRYHPDTGGDSAKFIELIERYRRLGDR